MPIRWNPIYLVYMQTVKTQTQMQCNKVKEYEYVCVFERERERKRENEEEKEKQWANKRIIRILLLPIWSKLKYFFSS